MSRKAIGTVDWRANPDRPGTFCWCARFTRADGTKTPWQPLDPRIHEGDRAGADACAAQLAPTARATTKDGKGETVAKYSERWLAERKTRVVSVKDDDARLRDHVLPLVGDASVLRLTRDDCERVRDALDDKVAAGAIGWKTARHAWQIFRSMCADLANARRRELRVRDTDPAAGIKPTLRGNSKSKQYLYPSEFLRFMACDIVPRDWRVAVALALFTYGRDGEVAELHWPDVDLEHGILTIARARDRETGAAKSTKTGGTRRFSVEPNLLPMLKAMHAEAKGQGRVFALDATHLSRTFRRWLLVAGVTRAELHATTATSRPITWHDLRASAATWMAVR
ncbi:MAG: tyrosine-type recombinase/integrase, partial [Polyangiaceae bacterium]